MSESQLEFSLKFKEVGSLLIDVRSLGLQNLLKKNNVSQMFIPNKVVMKDTVTISYKDKKSNSATYLVEALHLQRGLGDGEVDHGHTGADVRRELDRRVASRKEDCKRRRQIDVLRKFLHEKVQNNKI